MVGAAGSGADRAEQQSVGSHEAASCLSPFDHSGVVTGDPGDRPVCLSVVLETTANEASLILSGRLDVGTLVAFEVAVEQLALMASPSVRVDVRGLTAVDRTGLCSLRTFGRWARDRGVTLRVEPGRVPGSSELGFVLSEALGDRNVEDSLGQGSDFVFVAHANSSET